jgi:hypothetical protein
MAEETVRLRVYRGEGKLTPAQVQTVLGAINEELKDPASEASREAKNIGAQVDNLRLPTEASAFVAEAFIIAMAIKFAGGAAAAGGALFFNKVIKPRFDKVSDGAVKRAEPVADEAK